MSLSSLGVSFTLLALVCCTPAQPIGAVGAVVVVAPAPAPVPSVSPTAELASPTAKPVYDVLPIPTGEFMMGSSDGYRDEQPVHYVRVEAFAMDRTPVTAAAYERCVSAGACSAAETRAYCNTGDSSRANDPINCVDWEQARAYCAWAGGRLPTEEEWEYAARGTDGRTYPWGEGDGSDEDILARTCWRRGLQGTCPVGSYPAGASPFGVLDMVGNVWELTASGYREDYESDPVDTLRVLRGSSWGNEFASDLRAASRLPGSMVNRSTLIGFRCAHTNLVATLPP